MSPAMIDANAASKLFRCELYLAESLGNGAIKVDTCISYPDHSMSAADDGFDVDAFLLGRMDDPVEQIPQYIGQHVFIRVKFQLAIDVIQYEAFPVYGQWEEAICQCVYKIPEEDP
jgi:hypothetical protein